MDKFLSNLAFLCLTRPVTLGLSNDETDRLIFDGEEIGEGSLVQARDSASRMSCVDVVSGFLSYKKEDLFLLRGKSECSRSTRFDWLEMMAGIG